MRQKPNISIHTPHHKKMLGPLTAWALGLRTPGLCLWPALNVATFLFDPFFLLSLHLFHLFFYNFPFFVPQFGLLMSVLFRNYFGLKMVNELIL